MTCSSCVETVTKSIEKINEVIKVEVSLESSTAEIEVKDLVKECEEFAENSPFPEISQLHDVVYEQEDYPFIQKS